MSVEQWIYIGGKPGVDSVLAPLEQISFGVGDSTVVWRAGARNGVLISARSHLEDYDAWQFPSGFSAWLPKIANVIVGCSDPVIDLWVLLEPEIARVRELNEAKNAERED